MVVMSPSRGRRSDRPKLTPFLHGVGTIDVVLFEACGFSPFEVLQTCKNTGRAPATDPSPGPRRLMKAPSRTTLSPRERADSLIPAHCPLPSSYSGTPFIEYELRTRT